MVRMTDPQSSGSARRERTLRLLFWLAARLLYRIFGQRLQGNHAVTEMALDWMGLQPRRKAAFEDGGRTRNVLLQ